MTRVIILLSIIGWAWTIIVFAGLFIWQRRQCVHDRAHGFDAADAGESRAG